MEEQRIGMMYWNVFRERIARTWDRLFPRGLRRSPFLPFLVLAVVIVVPTVGWLLHIRGKFHTVSAIITGDPVVTELPKPGGLPPFFLKLPASKDASAVQFLSATFLPGLGMDILQITAQLPGRGEVPLLKAPSIEAMADGTAGPRRSGDDLRGAIEIPWAGNMTGVVTMLGTTMNLNWQGHTLEVPTNAEGQLGVARGGLLSRRGPDWVSKLDGTTAFATSFHPTDFDGHWPSMTEINMYARLRETSIFISVTVRNAGGQPEPIGVGWHPRFAIPSGNRQAALVRLPGGQQLEILNRAKDAVTGQTIAMSPYEAGFTQREQPLGDKTLDMVLTHLKPAQPGGFPESVLIDPASGFGLRLKAASASIREASVSSPAGEGYVALGLQTNYEDPLGKEWDDPADPGMVVLQPGDSLEWKILLEIFPVPKP